MAFHAMKHEVFNRGIPPDSFLEELIEWGKQASDELFEPNDNADIYFSIAEILGPWKDIAYRKAVMLEVMRVLAGFESSWDWNAGPDKSNPASITEVTMEAGAWQVSADSLKFGQDLKDLVSAKTGTLNGSAFQKAMKQNHPLAMEYIARLLRHTTHHNGPVERHQIDPWLRQDAVAEFQSALLA